MFRLISAAVSASALLAACGAADAESVTLDDVLAAEIRADDSARDVYRRPKETLAFFGVEPTMTVGEYGPGGGWYTRVLAPWVAETGTYVAITADVELFGVTDPEALANAKAWPTAFPAQAAEWTGVDAASLVAIESDEPTDAVAGELDAILVFRGMHGLVRREIADSVIADFYDLLKPGGVVGVVQHRASEDAPRDYVNGTNGYLKQSEVIALYESEGFDFVGDSDLNANPNDPANHEGGVWTLPPTLRYGDENRAEYEAIGESNRMTLLFRKPA